MKKKLQHFLFHKTRSRVQYFLPLLLIVFLLVGILGSMMLNTSELNHQIEENTINYADDVSAQLASNISSRMKMRQTYICNLADTLSDTPISVIDEELLNRKASYLDMDEIFVVNADGSTIPADEQHAGLGEYLAKTPELYTDSRIFFTQHEEVFYAAPIVRKNSEDSLLIGVRTIKTLQKMLQDVNFREQGISCIVDSHGTVIVSATEERPFQELADVLRGDLSSEDGEEARKVLENIEAQKSGTAQFESINNEPVMLGYDFLGINDWILLTLVPSDLFSRGTEVFMIRYGLIVGIAAFVMLLILISIVWFYRCSLKRIQNVALTDPLTEGSNFSAFQMEGDSILRGHSSRDYAIVYLNIRNFKRFNERFGVTYGDSLLRAVYNVLKSCLRENELMARSSGDHFYLMLVCSDEASVRERLNDIFSFIEGQLSEKFSLDRTNFAQGAYIVKERDVEFLILTDRAKAASLYQERTSECRFYDDALGEKVEQEHTLEDSFERAIQNHEFKIYIQPKVRPGQKEADSGEVLVRWEYPGYGMIYPGDFIPLFERSGKICDLDFYMFEETCKLMRRWLEEGKAVPLSVNLSRAHLVSSNLSFLERFKTIKEQYEIPDNLIELELTESLMLERREVSLVAVMIDKIREMGMLCSIDDFGFGYSPLTMLKDLNVTTVKLDRQFFLSESGKAWIVIQQLIQLAHDLDMTVVAEGIESYEQVEQLQLYGCDLIQGYVYAKSMPVSDFEVWSDRAVRPEVKQDKPIGDSIAPKKTSLMNSMDIINLYEGNDYKNRLTVALKAAKICIYEVDLTRQLYTFFENAEMIFGISGEEILKTVQPYSSLSPSEYREAVSAYFAHPDDEETIAHAFENILAGHSVSYTARMRVGDGQYIWCKLDVTPIVENGRPVRMIGIITDISDMRRQKEQLEQKANLDGFTGLWNKPTSITLIKEALEQEPNGRHALLLTDIDNFKHFNDTYGHLRGDEVIAATARHFADIFNDGSMVGRFGGDEFIVFIRNVLNMDILEEQARNMTRVEYEAYSSTNSVGISLYPDNGISFEELFEQADQALYRAKEKRCDVAFAISVMSSDES